jgi:hypothetical protein
VLGCTDRYFIILSALGRGHSRLASPGRLLVQLGWGLLNGNTPAGLSFPPNLAFRFHLVSLWQIENGKSIFTYAFKGYRLYSRIPTALPKTLFYHPWTKSVRTDSEQLGQQPRDIRAWYRRSQWVKWVNPSAWWCNWATMFGGEGGYIITGTWPSRLGESAIRDSNIYSWVLQNSDTRITALARRGPAAVLNYRPVLSSVQRGRPHKNKPANDSNTSLVIGPRYVPDTKTD